AAAAGASQDFYRADGHDAIPGRGSLAALTVAGAVSGWQEALRISLEWEGRIPLARLFEDAIHYAKHGVPVTQTQHANTETKRAELEPVPSFADVFLPEGAAPPVGALFRQPKLAEKLRHLAESGLDDFYRGDLARLMASELEAAGSPLRLADLEAHAAQRVAPLALALAGARVFNMPPPTQGIASLMILGIFERLDRPEPESTAYVHGLVEAAKRAFLVRDAHVTDPAYMTVDPSDFLTDAALAERAADIDADKALPWPQPAAPGDTVWLGAIDGAGRAVSFIQSVYWEFGSGLVLPRSGVLWQNRGTSFALDDGATNALKPGRKPFHTIQPAMALFADGRVMPYGTMGGEGQPQTQSALYTRYAHYGQGLQEAVAAPRWLLGRTWGADITNLRLESRFSDEIVTALKAAGHDVELVGPMDEVMGHAGALVRHPDGTIEGASDPRSDGAVAGF
ncbi:MAG: gamma-glutamyltransferase family protein, partial [Methyloligellaceae bacterium]